jgi:hypothetical protein
MRLRAGASLERGRRSSTELTCFDEIEDPKKSSILPADNIAM